MAASLPTPKPTLARPRGRASDESKSSAARTIDFSRSAVARYLQLAALFRRRVASGQWAVGNQIPTVEELAAQCGVARATVRQALDQLEVDGLIQRFRAKGTFVRECPEQNLWCEVRTDWSGMLLARDGARIEVLDSRVVAELPGPLAGSGIAAPAYRLLRRRHWRGKTPFLLASVYVEKRLSRRISERALREKTALKLIADIPGLEIFEARQTLTIGTADPEVASYLEIALNAPVAFVRRVAVDANGAIVLLADGIYRGDVVRMDMKLK